MATRTIICAGCKAKLNVGSTDTRAVCPHCRTTLDIPPPTAKPAITGKQWLWTLAILGVLVYGCMKWVGSTEKNGVDYAAEAECQVNGVEPQLKSPGSADYSGTVAVHTGNRWTVRGDVDSQNGFGAMLRSSYVCTTRYVPSTDSYTDTEAILTSD